MKNHAAKLEQNTQWFNSWAPTYDRGIVGPWLRAVQNQVIRTLHQRPLTEQTSVLDIGCGTGYLLQQLSTTITEGKLAGVDISPVMIDQAVRKLSSQKNVEVLTANVETLPYHHHTFDYVITTDAFHHFPDPVRALFEMKRVLKQRGTMIIVDVHVPPTFLGNMLFTLEPGFVSMYSRKDMHVLANRVGLRIVEQHRAVWFALMHIIHRSAVQNV